MQITKSVRGAREAVVNPLSESLPGAVSRGPETEGGCAARTAAQIGCGRAFSHRRSVVCTERWASLAVRLVGNEDDRIAVRVHVLPILDAEIRCPFDSEVTDDDLTLDGRSAGIAVHGDLRAGRVKEPADVELAVTLAVEERTVGDPDGHFGEATGIRDRLRCLEVQVAVFGIDEVACAGHVEEDTLCFEPGVGIAELDGRVVEVHDWNAAWVSGELDNACLRAGSTSAGAGEVAGQLQSTIEARAESDGFRARWELPTFEGSGVAGAIGAPVVAERAVRRR